MNWKRIKEGMKHPLLFAIIQGAYLFFKIGFVIFITQTWESILPAFIRSIIPKQWVVFVALFYFIIITIWFFCMVFAVLYIQKQKHYSQEEKTKLFWEQFSNIQEIRKSKPQKRILRGAYYLKIIIAAPWIWLTAIPRFVGIGKTIRSRDRRRIVT